MEDIFKYIKGSNIYKYYQETEDPLLKILGENFVMPSPVMNYPKLMDEIMCHFYKNIVANNWMDLIVAILKRGPKGEPDELYLSLIAIDDENYEILKILYEKTDSRISSVTLDMLFKMHGDSRIPTVTQDIFKTRADCILAYAYEKKGLNMLIYIADLVKDKRELVWYACSFQNEAFLDHLLIFKLEEDYLYHGLLGLLENNSSKSINLSILEKLLKEINILRRSSKLDWALCRYNVDIVKLFLEYGMILDDNSLMSAYRVENIELIDFYLSYGLKPDIHLLVSSLKGKKNKILELFMKHNIDFSAIQNNNHDDWIRKLESYGLDRTTYLNILLELQ